MQLLARSKLLALLALLLASPAMSQVRVAPVMTSAERAAFPKKYPDLAKLVAARAVLPGLEDGYVPQGVAWIGRGNLVLLSHYSEKASSIFSVVDLDDGRLVRSVQLNAAGGKPYTGHAGGVAVLGAYVWTGNGGRLMRYKLTHVLEQPAKASAGFNPIAGLRSARSTISPDRIYGVDSKVSFVSADAGSNTLWVGDFHHPDNEDYATPKHHHRGSKSAWIAAYRVDPATGLLKARTTYKVGSLTVLRPDHVLFVRSDVQGMAVAGDTVALSVSYGSDDSKLAFYRSPRAQRPERVELPGGNATAGRVLDDGEWIRTIPMPCNSEDLEWNGRHLLVAFESAAPPYREKRRAAKKLIEDRLFAIRLK